LHVQSSADVASVTVTDVLSPVFNSVAGARFDPAGADARIAQIVAEYRRRDVPAQWWVGPSASPADLGPRLTAHGFSHEGDLPGMAADLAAMDFDRPLPDGLEIAEVRNASVLIDEWTPVFGADTDWSPSVLRTYIESLTAPGFDTSLPFRHFVGRLEGEPVATSSVLCARGVVGLFGEGTVPSARRRGIGAAMALAALRWGAERGYRVGVTVATDMGRSVYAKIGFRHVCAVSLYRLPRAASERPK
jgi:GNAT superfamily N-acetyltransferase